MKTENLSTLKINKLSQAQYDRELVADNIEPNALYLTPDDSDEKYISQTYTKLNGSMTIDCNELGGISIENGSIFIYNTNDDGTNSGVEIEVSGTPDNANINFIDVESGNNSSTSLSGLKNIDINGLLNIYTDDGNKASIGVDDDNECMRLEYKSNTIRLNGIDEPIAVNDAANKSYVDTNINTLSTQVTNLDDELGDLSSTVNNHTASIKSNSEGLSSLSSIVSKHTDSIDTKLTKYAWSVTHKDLKWMRLCHVTSTTLFGSSFILNLAHTRGNTVYNDTYIIKAHHNKKGQISKISGSEYTSGLQLRVVSDYYGNCYVDLYDNTGNESTSAIVYCRLIPLSVNTVTTYTSVEGEDIPNGFAVAATLTTNNNPVQYSNINVLSSDYYGDSLPTAGTKGRIFFKVVS